MIIMINKVVYGTTVLVDLTDLQTEASNVVSGINGVDKAGNKFVGGLVIQKYYTGSTSPSSTLGNNGDLYLKV